MSLLGLIAVLILFGLVMWAVSAFPWIDGNVKTVIYIVIVIFLVVWLLQSFGVLPALGSVRIK